MNARGIRNNNPLNIRHGCKWNGLCKIQTDKSFDQFISMQYGIRAGFIILRKYINVYKANSISKIISRWAPRCENDTTNYINVVSKKSGYNKDKIILFSDKSLMCKIASAMIEVECGTTIDMNTILSGYNMI